jgi:hypothetical protein
LIVSDNSLNDVNLNAFGIFDLVVFIALDRHVERKFFFEEFLLDEESSRRQRFAEICVFLHSCHHVCLEQSVFIENEQFSLLFTEVAIIKAFTTESGFALLASDIEKASFRNSEKGVAAVADDRSIEDFEFVVPTFMLLFLTLLTL